MSPAAVSGSHARAACACLLASCLLLAPALASAIYSHATTAFDFVATNTHTRITSWPGCSDTTGDDSLSAPLDIGFTFNFGGVDYTRVRVHTNGRLQFNSTACGAGTQSVGPPRTYTFPLPNASMDRVMRIYGADLDLGSGGTITVATTGSAPDRRFIVTWNAVGAWREGGANNVGAGTSYTLQIQLLESGEFRYMYGDSDNVSEPSNTNMGPAQIGWQLNTSEFRVVQSGLPANRSGIRFFIPAPVAEYRFEQTTLTGATGEVLDSSGNGLHGTRVDSPVNNARVTSVTGRVCRGIDVPNVSNRSNIDAIDTGLPPQKIGSTGTITLWYKSRLSWANQDNAIFDASGSNKQWFIFGKGKDGKLKFAVADSKSSPNLVEAEADMGNLSADTWRHLAVSWNLRGTDSRLRIYVDGVLRTTMLKDTTGLLSSSLRTLLIGDMRGVDSNFSSETTGAGGQIDEVRIYSFEAQQAVIQRDMAVTRTCGGIDHLSISHGGTAAICEPATVKFSALTADNTVVANYASTIKFATSSGRGDWTLLSGSGSLDNGAADDGVASYNFVSADGGAVALGLRHTVAGTLNLDVTDGTVSERSGAATAADDPDLEFVEAGFVFTANGVAGALGTQIAGKPSSTAPGAQSLAIRAVRTKADTGACEAALLGTQVVEMGFECVAPGKCSGRAFTVDGGSATSIAGNAGGSVSAFTPLKLEFDAKGSAPFSALFDDAGSVRLHARHALNDAGGKPTGDFLHGTSNTFVWRPFALDITVPGNPGATTAAGAAFMAAGATFGASVRAVVWHAADDRNNDGIADGMQSGDTNPANNARLSDNSTAPNFAPGAPLSLGATLLQPVGGRHPGLAGSPAASMSAGVATVAGLRYDETGIVELSAVQSGDYLGIGSAATAAIRGLSGSVGRFHPARFAVAANTPTFANACDKGGFSYLDQAFGFDVAPVLTLTAQTVNGSTTQNYTTTGFFRFKSQLDGRSAVDDAARALVHAAGGGATAAGTDTGRGIFTLSLPNGASGDRFTYSRAEPVAPFAASVDLTIPAAALTDTDKVCADLNGDGACDDYTLETIGGTTLRYGRLATDNVLGAEVLPLAAPVRAEYFNGSGFVRNDADVCTAITVKSLDLGIGSPDEAPSAGEIGIRIGDGESTAAVAHEPLASGLLGLSFSAPGAGNVGELDYRIDLDVASSPWLRYDWNGDGKPEDPRGRASFGLFAGPRSIVYRRDFWR